ncbi:MAG TPA: hypothetical protein VKU02_19895 [Gemmataceae bacterium]|nr:hypothetical protein [Gemmataceae bacterium]
MYESTIPTFAISVPARRKPRRWLVWILSVPLFAGLAYMSLAFYLNGQNERELRKAEAEADLLDPGWRLSDLEAARAPVPDSENGALQLLAAAKLVPASWPKLPPPAKDDRWGDRLLELAPQMRPGRKLLDAMDEAMKQVLPGLAEARRLAAYPRGHYGITWSNKLLLQTAITHLDLVHRIQRVLSVDAVMLAERGDMSGAAQSCLALLNVGRSIGDEPLPISQIFRVNCQLAAERSMERLLAQGEPSAAVLQKLQQELEDEAAQPLLLRAFRSYRATMHQDLAALQSGQVDRRSLRLVNPYGLPDQALTWNDTWRARACHPDYLRYLNELVEVAKLPPEQQSPRLDKLELPSIQKPTISFLLEIPDKQLRALHHRFLAAVALLRCAETGLAIERYRRDSQRWPGALADLVPVYLRQAPRDPFDGAVLRYRHLEDGVVIYSIGPDGLDHHGQLKRDMQTFEGFDLGFQLWNAANRRQSAAADLDDEIDRDES